MNLNMVGSRLTQQHSMVGTLHILMIWHNES